MKRFKKNDNAKRIAAAALAGVLVLAMVLGLVAPFFYHF